MAMMNPYNYKKPIGVVVPPQDKVVSNATRIDASQPKVDSYLEQQVMNARPEELTMMLYDGIVKFIRQAMLFNDQKNIAKSNEANLRAQAILQELRSTLNMDIEISINLESLYIYMMDRLVDGNIKRNNEILEEVLELAIDLRDTWKEAMSLQ